MKRSTSHHYRIRRRIADRYGLYLPAERHRDLLRDVAIEKVTKEISVLQMTLAGQRVCMTVAAGLPVTCYRRRMARQ